MNVHFINLKYLSLQFPVFFSQHCCMCHLNTKDTSKAHTLGSLVTPLHSPTWSWWLWACWVSVWVEVICSPNIKEKASISPCDSEAQYSVLVGSGSQISSVHHSTVMNTS